MQLIRAAGPANQFHHPDYLRHNQRRQEHLASLGLPLAGRTVLEVGAGVGDHTSFFLDRGCEVTVTDARRRNLRSIRKRFPDHEVRLLDLDRPNPQIAGAQVVYCYGTLYHLAKPAEAIAYLAQRCDELMLVETCVSTGHDSLLNPQREDARLPSQATSGKGCRPTRRWVWSELARHFPHVYSPKTQPWHEEFPLDWSVDAAPDRLTRAVFIAARSALDNPLLLSDLPLRQSRH